ncbi:hypothetical protein D3C78_1058660 [compost metagenome]
MLDKHARHVPQLDGLVSQGERAGDDGLGSDDGGQRGKCDHRQQCPARRQQVERVAHRLRVVQDQRALAKVIEYQPWQHQDEPRAGNRLATKVAHVGVQRLGAGQCQNHRPQDRHADPRVNHKEAYRPSRVERLEHFRALQNTVDAEHAQHHKPQHHDRAKQNTDAGRAVFLDQEQRHQNDHGQGDDPVLDTIKGQLQPFNRRKHRNGRGDHAIPVKQRRTEQTQQNQHPTHVRVGRCRPPGQCRQCHDAAFALIVGTQDEQHVFDRDHPDQ